MVNRRIGRLRGSRMLFKSCMPFKPTVRISTETYWCTITKTTTGYNRIVLWTNEIFNWRRQSAELCQTGNIQRKVSLSNSIQFDNDKWKEKHRNDIHIYLFETETKHSLSHLTHQKENSINFCSRWEQYCSKKCDEMNMIRILQICIHMNPIIKTFTVYVVLHCTLYHFVLCMENRP